MADEKDRWKRIDEHRLLYWLYLECFAVCFVWRVWTWPTPDAWYYIVLSSLYIAFLLAIVPWVCLMWTVRRCLHPSDTYLPPSPHNPGDF
jgi:hypothetical protein